MKRTLGCVALFGWLMVQRLFAGASFPRRCLRHESRKGAQGTVEKVQFVNPHGSLTISVKNPDGTTTEWVFTLGSATALAQRGVGKIGPNALHTGDNIKVKCIPAKDGHPLGFLKSITYPDGHVIVSLRRR